MPNQFGAINVPVQQVAPGQAPGDPALSYLLAFLQAFLNTDDNAKTAFAQVGVAAGYQVVKQVQPYDPSEIAFKSQDLPCLYGWREGGVQDIWGEDWLIEKADIRLLWVFPLPTQAAQVPRGTFANAFVKAVQVAIDRGRTPSFIIPTDPYPHAGTEGTLITDAMNAVHLFFVNWRKSELRVPIQDGRTDVLPAIEITIDFKEHLQYGLDRFDVLQAVDQKIFNAGQTSPAIPPELVDEALLT